MVNHSTDDIIEFMSNYTLESVLSGIIEMQMTLYGHDETFISASEYLAANALVACNSESKKPFMWADYQRLEKLGKTAFVPSIEDIFSSAAKMVDKSDEEKEDFLQSTMMRLKGSMFRGDGYIHQLVESARLFYAPMDCVMKEKLGFSYTSCEKVIRYIFSQYGMRTKIAHKEKNKFKNMLKVFMSKEQPWVPSIREGYIFRITKDELKNIIGDEVEPLCKYLSVKAYSKNLNSVEYEDFKILTSKPFVDFGDYIYMPLLFSTLMNLPKLFHYSFIAEKQFDKKTVGLYTDNRGNVVEELTSSYLKRILKKEKVLRSLAYLDEDGEADVTTIDESFQLFCECKSKILTLNSFKGQNESIDNDVYQAIGVAYSQAVRTIQRVKEGKKFLSLEGKEIELFDSPYKYVLCVTAENFGRIPTEIEKYIQIDTTVGIPYVVNIYDLDIITQECKSYEEFIDYIDFRNKNHKLIAAFDELDVFGYFKENGNKSIKVDADELNITNYTYKFDMKYRMKDKLIFEEFIESSKLK